MFILLLLLISCTKTSQEFVVPNSTPYMLELKQTFYPAKGNYISINPAKLPNEDNKALIISQNSKKDVHDSQLKSIILLFYMYPIRKSDQVSFNEFVYPGINRVYAIPHIFDVNNNGIIELAFLMDFADSLVFGIYEMTNSKPIRERWLRWLRLNKEYNHYLDFIALWDVPDSESKIVLLNKGNRLFSPNQTVDTLILYNIITDEYVKSAMGAYISLQELDYVYTSKNLFFVSGITSNGLQYGELNDTAAFALAIDTNANLLWYEYLSAKSIEVVQTNQIFDNTYINLVDADSLVSFYDINTFEKRKSFKSGLSMTNVIRLNAHELGIVGQENNVIYVLDTNGNIMWSKKHNLKIINFIENYNALTGHHINSKYTLSGRKYLKYDINNNGYNDFFITTNNQFLLIDGKTLEVLFTTEKYENTSSVFIVPSNEENEFDCWFTNDNKIYYYRVVKTPLLTRILIYNNEIYIVILILIILPILIFTYIKIKFNRSLFRALASKSGTEGIIVISNNRKIVIINSKAQEIVNTYQNKQIESDIKFNELIQKVENNNQEYQTKIEFYGSAKLFLLLTIKKFNAAFNKKYFLLTFNDITNILDEQKNSNTIKTALLITHNIKNLLGTAQLQLDNMMLNLNKTGSYYNNDVIERAEKIISDSILEAGDIVRRISYIAKEIVNSSLIKTNLYNFISEWILQYANRYSRRDINIINNIDYINDYDINIMLNSTSFDLLLQTACDNSAEAFDTSKNNVMNIIFKLEKKDNRLHFSIIDNGKGMETKTLEMIRKNTGFSSKRTGSGLGMSLIYKVVKEHNAILNVESEINNGTTLTIIFNTNEIQNETQNSYS